MAQEFEGQHRPAQVLMTVEDWSKFKGQYIRHNDTKEIFKILEVGSEGVTCYQVAHFGADPDMDGQEYLVTWPSLQYKHRVMVHVSDVAAPSRFT